jgi:predicted ribosomally synthesized peptide with SipW-like signal peptide
MFNRKILLSFMSIVAAFAMAGGATYAYFTSSQTVSGNTISTGTLKFQAVVQDTTGLGANFSDTNLAPGETYTRCLWVANTGSVAGRFKVYVSAESGDTTLGNGLTVSKVVMNPTTGECSSLSTNPFTGDTIYGPNDYAIPGLTNIAVRGPLLSQKDTPFKIDSASDPMEGGYYALYAVTIKLDPNSTAQNTSYTTDMTVYGMQAEGSGPSTGW